MNDETKDATVHSLDDLRAAKVAASGVKVIEWPGHPHEASHLTTVCTLRSSGEKRVAIYTPTLGELWGLTPDQADAFALEVIRMAECARLANANGGG